MVLPVVVLLIVTLCVPIYEPSAGENAGVAHVGVLPLPGVYFTDKLVTQAFPFPTKV